MTKTKPRVIMKPTRVGTIPGYTVETGANLIKASTGQVYVDITQANVAEDSLRYSGNGHLEVVDEHGELVVDNGGVFLTIEMLRAILETAEEMVCAEH